MASSLCEELRHHLPERLWSLPSSTPWWPDPPAAPSSPHPSSPLVLANSDLTPRGHPKKFTRTTVSNKNFTRTVRVNFLHRPSMHEKVYASHTTVLRGLSGNAVRHRGCLQSCWTAIEDNGERTSPSSKPGTPPPSISATNCQRRVQLPSPHQSPDDPWSP